MELFFTNDLRLVNLLTIALLSLAFGSSTPKQIPTTPPKMRNKIRSFIARGNCNNFCTNAIRTKVELIGAALKSGLFVTQN